MQYKDMKKEAESSKKKINKIKKKYELTKPVSKDPLPCPFCGKDAEIDHPEEDIWGVTCSNPCCLSVYTSWFTTKKMAVKKWNHRVL